MAAHRARRATGALIDNMPWPSTILGLAFAGSTWPPLPQSTGPVPTITITPDDPAAPTPVPVQDLGR